MNTVSGIWTDLQAAWQFFVLLNSTAPLWLWTTLFGYAVTWSVTGFSKRFLARVTPLEGFIDEPLARRKRDRREAYIETTALAVGIASTWLLHRGLPGLLLGILVGFSAPFIWTWLLVICRPLHAAWMRHWGKP